MRAALVALVVLAGCPDPEWVSVSSTIVEDAGRFVVTSPDDDGLAFVDTDLRTNVARQERTAPSHVVVTRDGWFTTSRSEHAEGLPCSGTGAAVRTRDDRVVVACPNDGLVGRWDGTATAEVDRPAALALVDDVLHVASGDRIVTLDADTLETLDARAVDRPEGSSVSPVSVLAVDSGGAPAAVYTVVENADRTVPPEDGGYGSVVDGSPRIQPWIDHPRCGGPYAVFDGGDRVFSDPAAAVFDDDGRLWIAHRGTRNVAVLECRAGDTILVANQAIGAGARGMMMFGDAAYVDVGFDHAIARVGLDGPPTSVRRAVAEERWSAAADRGRRVFFDATDTHLTPSGIVSCGTCHPGGGEDGLTWFLHTVNVPRKLRRTPPAWGADPATKPLHWDGEFDDAEVLVGTTIRELMGGDALVIAPADVAAFMRELEPPPGRPVEPEAEAAYVAAGCPTCHAGDALTDGLAHTVVPSSTDEDADLDPVFTPSLRGVRTRGPWLHDGRAATLRSVFEEHAAGAHAGPPDLELVLRHLESL